MSVIRDIFAPIYGKPCWQAHHGYGSFLTFEFGEPHLEITEPRRASANASAKMQKFAARRLVTVRGDWHLWIYGCDWRILSHGRFLADNESSQRVIAKATSELNGQLLVRVSVHKSLVTEFEFDLGGKLETRPYRENFKATDELWFLHDLSDYAFALRADGQYSHSRDDTGPDEHIWHPLKS